MKSVVQNPHNYWRHVYVQSQSANPDQYPATGVTPTVFISPHKTLARNLRFLGLFVYGLRGFPHSPVYYGSRNLDIKRSLLTLSQLYIFLPCNLTKIGRVHRTKLIILRNKARQKRMEKCCFQSSILLQSALRYNVIVLCGKDLVFPFKTNYIISVKRREQTQC